MWAEAYILSRSFLCSYLERVLQAKKTASVKVPRWERTWNVWWIIDKRPCDKQAILKDFAFYYHVAEEMGNVVWYGIKIKGKNKAESQRGYVVRSRANYTLCKSHHISLGDILFQWTLKWTVALPAILKQTKASSINQNVMTL